MTEPKAEYMTESSNEENKRCPFCKGIVDPTGWMADSGGNFISGPECESCGATAQSIEQWNTRPESDATEGDLVDLIDEKEKWVIQAIGRMNASSEGLVRIPRDQAELIAKTLRQAGIALSTPQQAAPIEAEEQVGNALLSAKGLIETLYSFVPYDAKMGPAISITVKELNNAMDALSALHSRSGMVSISRECADEARELFLFEALTEEEKAFNFTEGSDSYKKHMRRAAYPKAYADHIKQSLEQSNGR